MARFHDRSEKRLKKRAFKKKDSAIPWLRASGPTVEHYESGWNGRECRGPISINSKDAI